MSSLKMQSGSPADSGQRRPIFALNRWRSAARRRRDGVQKIQAGTINWRRPRKESRSIQRSVFSTLSDRRHCTGPGRRDRTLAPSLLPVRLQPPGIVPAVLPPGRRSVEELANATPSAPKHKALKKSAGVRRPPVMISETSLWPTRSKCFRARAKATMVGTEM